MTHPPHTHLWSVWMPQDRAHKYRHCLRPYCPAVETRKVMA